MIKIYQLVPALPNSINNFIIYKDISVTLRRVFNFLANILFSKNEQMTCTFFCHLFRCAPIWIKKRKYMKYYSPIKICGNRKKPWVIFLFICPNWYRKHMLSFTSIIDHNVYTMIEIPKWNWNWNWMKCEFMLR